ncbi:MAG: TIGR02147 family protein [Fibrobacter sp.]|nr:TIGR02147 family protein [Fibrobacter sp.]
MSSIFDFIDYRKFLSAYYSAQKKNNRHFSYRYFALKAGISSPSFLKLVIDGKRNLTEPAIEKFITAMKLNKKEAAYFHNLVLFNQAKTAVAKQEHYAVLRTMAGTVKESVLNGDLFDYFSEWYVPVIRELITLYDFQDDYKKIASMINPPIQPSEVKSAIKLLLRLKLLIKQENGLYKQKYPALVVDGSVLSIALQKFTSTMIDHSKTALERINFSERHISGITMGISPKTYDILTAEIEAFKERVKIIVNKDEKSSVVYQLNLALFPVSGNTNLLEESEELEKE